MTLALNDIAEYAAHTCFREKIAGGVCVILRRACRVMYSVALICVSLAWLAVPGRASDVTIFAAASLKTALDEVAATFQDHTTAISYAGTSVLARQISLGAPADIFIAASADWMDWLADQNAIEPATRFDLLSNRLVLIQHGADAAAIAPTGPDVLDAIGQNRVAMALVEAVPAGIYGKSALEHFGIWDRLAPQIVQTDNVRATLALVARGEASFGIVYATDGLAEPRVSEITRFPKESHAQIVYPVAVPSGRASETTRQFLSHLRSNQARAIFQSHGFRVGPTP